MAVTPREAISVGFKPNENEGSVCWNAGDVGGSIRFEFLSRIMGGACAPGELWVQNFSWENRRGRKHFIGLEADVRILLVLVIRFGDMDCINLARDRVQYQAVMGTVMSPLLP
jgi:hypothetical protein